LTQFQQKFNIPPENVSTIIGSNNATECPVNINDCAEANLDVQYITSVAQQAPTTYWSVSSNGDIFLDWIVAVANMTNPPFVHSMSYGSIEVEEDPTDMNRFDMEAQKLGTRGLSIIISSGDDGVANFLARSDPSSCGFSPSFPATSPHVTALGATQGPEYGGAPEIVCSSGTGGLITSGGGFSTVFTIPSFQTDFVNAYLSSSVQLPPSSMYNQAGRGYPDLSLVGHNYVVVIGGQYYQVSGTSCTAPTFAGMVSLINDARFNAGKSPLGFLNPSLYQFASTQGIFNDITVGLNNCCAGSPPTVCCQYGFYATSGWDPTTGLGSVNFNALMSAFMAM
jgi:tripeptidyl-peptidase-1